MPSFVLWTLIYPLWTLIYLNDKKKFLFTSKYKNTIGFLYRDFKPKYYYWGVLNLTKKIVYIICINFLALDISRQVLIIVFILFLFEGQQAKKQPFINAEINYFATFSLILLISTLIIKLFTFSIKIDGFDYILTLMLISVNLLFNLMILLKIFVLFCKKALPHIRTSIYLKQKIFKPKEKILKRKKINFKFPKALHQ